MDIFSSENLEKQNIDPRIFLIKIIEQLRIELKKRANLRKGKVTNRELGRLLTFNKNEQFIKNILYEARNRKKYKIHEDTINILYNGAKKYLGKNNITVKMINTLRKNLFLKNEKPTGVRYKFFERLIKIFSELYDYKVSVRKLSQIIFNNRSFLDRHLLKKGLFNTPIKLSILFFLDYKISNLRNLELDSKSLEKIKLKAKKSIKLYIFREGYLNSFDSLYEFNIIWKIAYTLSDIQGKPITSFKRIYQHITYNLRIGQTFSRLTVKKWQKQLDNICTGYIKDYIMEEIHQYIRIRSLNNLKNSYHRNWERLKLFHCYLLIIQSMGLDFWSGESIESDFFKSSSRFIRHHIDFDKRGIHLHRLALISLDNHNKISHPKRLGLSKDSILDKTILEAAKNNLECHKPPDHWSMKAKMEYKERLKMFQEKGENTFFMNFFPEFYDHFHKISKNKKKLHEFYLKRISN
jgi:hypothetical protein